ncbi:hypothetical protein D3C78_1249390 [compost metagenome]
MWVTRRAVVAVFGGKTVRIGVHIQHAGQQGTLAGQFADRPGVLFGRRVIAEQTGPRQGGFAGDVEQVFYRVRDRRQARQWKAFGTCAIEVIGFAQHAFARDVGIGVQRRIPCVNIL